jgi:hypothetical protein
MNTFPLQGIFGRNGIELCRHYHSSERIPAGELSFVDSGSDNELIVVGLLQRLSLLGNAYGSDQVQPKQQ